MTQATPPDRKRLVTGLFMEDASAERAWQACVARGYAPDDINVVVSEDTRRRLVQDRHPAAGELADRKAEGGELGGPTGGRAAVLITIVAAVGAALALPALGLAIAGPLAVSLAAAGGAGVAAGLLGALHDWGLPEERTRGYEAGVRDGGILLGVEARSDDDARAIAEQWRALGGRHVHG